MVLGPDVCLWQGVLRLSLVPFELRYRESKGFSNEQGLSTVPQTNFKGLENASFVCYGYKVKTELWRENGMNKQLTVVMASSGRKSCPWDGRGRLDSVMLNWVCIKAHVHTQDSWRHFLQTCPWVLRTLVDQSGQQMILLVWAPRGSWGSREDIAMENKPSSGTCFSRSLQRERQSILCVDNFYICGFN